MKNKIFFWQPLLTDHAIHTFMFAADAMGHEASAFVDTVKNSARSKQGWLAPGKVMPITRLPEHRWRSFANEIIDSHPDAVHIVGSPFEFSRINYVLLRLLWQKKRVFLVSEPYAPRTMSYLTSRPGLGDHIKTYLRPILYRLYGVLMKKNIHGIFAISPLASRQFQGIGIAREKIFPFGYFVPKAHDKTSRPYQYLDQLGSQEIRLAFVGSLIERKGVPTAIEAVISANQRKDVNGHIVFDIFGPGNVSDVNGMQDLPDSIRFMGALPFGTTGERMADYDIVVVPSLHDGWAVVVNEAIQAGCAVVASDGTGAAALVEKWKCGAVFPVEKSSDLERILVEYLKFPERLMTAKAQSRLLSPNLEPAYAGRYMAEAIASVNSASARPINNWY